MRSTAHRRPLTAAILLIAAVITAARSPLAAAGRATIILTANLGGAFTPMIQDQQKNDPLLLLAQSITAEYSRGAAAYFDLGNGFYPGMLSKHSYGAAMANFFTFTRCAGIVVGSQDLRLGAQSLEFLHKQDDTPFLTSTITRGGSTLFTPAVIREIAGKKIAFIGISSRRVLFDVAEKTVTGIDLRDPAESLKIIIPELKARGATGFVLLSGLDFQQNADLLMAFPELGLVITGGDNRGEVQKSQLLRADLTDGRSILFVPPGTGYTLLAVETGPTLRVTAVEQCEARAQTLSTDAYQDFIDRISLWKEKFRKEADRVIAEREGDSLRLDAERVANLLRHHFTAEVAIVKKSSVTGIDVGRELRYSDLLSAVNDLYPLYRFSMTGADLAAVLSGLDDCIATGPNPDRKKIQGYAIDEQRRYRIIATQLIHAECERLLQKPVPVVNTWKTIPDIMITDLQGERALLRKDFRYLENRFRAFMDLACSLLYDQTNIVLDKGMTLPVGETDQAYFKWGVDGRIDLTVYNRYHRIVITPSVNYVKNGTTLEKNLIRGAIVYALNFDKPVNPFFKSQADTVVTRVRGATMPYDIATIADQYNYYQYRRSYRPVTIRETLGIELITSLVTGRLGAGFEKQIHQPVRPFIYGFELSLKFSYAFTSDIAYTALIDSFISIPRLSAQPSTRDEWYSWLNISRSVDPAYIRCEFQNKLAFRLAPVVAVSFTHRLYYYYYLSNRKKYLNSQFVVAADLATGFKL